MEAHVPGEGDWILLRAEVARQTSVELCAEARELARWAAVCREARRSGPAESHAEYGREGERHAPVAPA